MLGFLLSVGFRVNGLSKVNGWSSHANLSKYRKVAAPEPADRLSRQSHISTGVRMLINVVIGFGLCFVALVGIWAICNPEEAKALREAEQFGPLNPHVVCSQCNTTGKCRVKPIDKKVGVSGGKATAAILTGGVSLLATGLSRKEKVSQVTCGHCKCSWQF